MPSLTRDNLNTQSVCELEEQLLVPKIVIDASRVDDNFITYSRAIILILFIAPALCVENWVRRSVDRWGTKSQSLLVGYTHEEEEEEHQQIAMNNLHIDRDERHGFSRGNGDHLTFRSSLPWPLTYRHQSYLSSAKHPRMLSKCSLALIFPLTQNVHLFRYAFELAHWQAARMQAEEEV